MGKFNANKPNLSAKRKSRKQQARRQYLLRLEKNRNANDHNSHEIQQPNEHLIRKCEETKNVLLPEENKSCCSNTRDIDSTSRTVSKDNSLFGRRIVNISFLFEQIQNVYHEGFGCTFKDLEFVNEHRRGMFSTFLFKCKMCGSKELITSDIDDETCNINTLVTSAALAIGTGFSQMEELFSSVDMPFMANNTYNKHHQKVSDIIKECAWEKMAEAAKEEKKIAVECGDTDDQGRPVIAVIADGAWSKRSYRTNYNALSGVASIIGAKTKKILYLGIKNKYCVLCERHTDKGSKNSHVCFKNYTGKSTTMEADIIVEGFRQSLNMYGLIYGKLIADGDSSVYSKILSSAPYGPLLHVEKIECKNHILRNYVSKLMDMKNNTSFEITHRKILESKIPKLRSSVSAALTYWKNETSTPFNERVLMLKTDITNGVAHTFGDHTNCMINKRAFCTSETRNQKIKSGEKNLVKLLKQNNFFEEILKRNRRVSDNAWSLLHNMNNNSAECYNSVVVKFIGGKRINFSLKGSYSARCEGAAVSFNSDRGSYHEEVHKKIGPNFGSFTKRYCDKICKKRTLKKQKLFKSKSCYEGPDFDYGLDLDNRPDMESDLYEVRKEIFLNKLSENIKKIEELTREQALSEIWVKERKIRVTASNFGRICKMRATTSASKIVENLLYCNFSGNIHTRYGQANEENAVQQFEKQQNIKTKHCGLIISPSLPYLAASPDRILDNNSALVEIKCPSNAKNLTPVEAVLQKKITFCKLENEKLVLKKNHNYWYQIQGQMSITNINKIYFVIWTPFGISVEIIYKDDTFCLHMIEKLNKFYFGALLPEIIDSRRTRNLSIRDFYMN